MFKRCPGVRSLVEPQIIVRRCPFCGEELEFFEYGVHGGPSTGMVFAAVKKEVEDGNINEGSVVLVISADS